jgi:hypothetical protein
MYATQSQLQNFFERWFNLAQHMIRRKKLTSRLLEQNKRDITTCLRQQHALNIKLVFAVATVTAAHTFAARASVMLKNRCKRLIDGEIRL